MAETIIKRVSAENLKQYDGLIKRYLETKDNAVKAALEEQIDIVAQAIQAEENRAKGEESKNATAASDAMAKGEEALAHSQALAGKVGEVPADKTVVGMIEEAQTNATYDDTEVRGLISGLDTNKADKTQVATDISNAVKAEEDARKEAVAGVQGEVDALEQTVAGNKSAIEGTVATLEQKVDANETDIEGKMTALTGRVATNETAVGTTLPNLINAEKERAEAAEEDLQTQINTIMNNPDTEGVINSINEFTQYIEDHGEIADGFRTDIDKNKDDIAALAQTHATDKSALESAINAKVAQSAYDEAIAGLQGEDASIKGRLDSLEGKVGTGDTTVDSKISTAKQEAIEAAAQDATQKANQSLADAKTYTNEEVAKDRLRLDALEAIDHDFASADTALETALKKYTDEEDAKIEARVDSLEAASATHALASDLTTANGKITTAEGKISTLESEMDEVQAELASIEFMSTTEVENLFA